MDIMSDAKRKHKPSMRLVNQSFHAVESLAAVENSSKKSHNQAKSSPQARIRIFNAKAQARRGERDPTSMQVGEEVNHAKLSWLLKYSH
jgi:hypothetical protein